MILPVIIAGGSGSRLWPMSRLTYPKQFLNMSGENTLLQNTVTRLDGIETHTPMIICNEEHRFLVAEQLRCIERTATIMLEPEGRNTAPAIALAALKATQSGEDPIILVLAADHLIKDDKEFTQIVNHSITIAEQNKLVTFGIVASSPETGYGYIRRGEEYQAGGFIVDQFVEKPDQETAKAYLESGNYYWNSGMFLFKASRFLQELEKFYPEILENCRECINLANDDLDFVRIDNALFKQCPSESIDYAVMEKTTDAVVVPMDVGWNDIGSWSSVWETNDKNSDGNLISGDIIVEESSNCLIHSEDRLVSAVGLDNIVIVDSKDAILVADKSKVQNVKKIVDQLKDSGREEWQKHREIYRPWGKYDSIAVGHRYQVKRITVNPGAKLSVQLHHHRAEHWIVVSGTAKVIKDEETFLISENESTYIPIGAIHSLENPGKVPLELIEVQTGSYLGEDDIIRIADSYGRS